MIFGVKTLLVGSYRNKDVFKKIADKMTDAGYDKTADQCNSKVRKLKLEYKIKDCRSKRTGRKEWRFIDAKDAVLGHKPATKINLISKEQEAGLNHQLHTHIHTYTLSPTDERICVIVTPTSVYNVQ